MRLRGLPGREGERRPLKSERPAVSREPFGHPARGIDTLTVAYIHDDWGAPAFPERELGADERVVARWTSAIERANKGRGLPLAMPSPLDVLPETMKARTLPPMPWPAAWPDLARRCRTYPGAIVGIVGGTGSGKTQMAVQLARAFAAAGHGCVLWAPLELSPPELNLRIVANLHGVHMAAIRDEWPERRIADALATVVDRWRYVPVPRAAVDLKLATMEEAVGIATQIYGAPPLLVIDYVQKLTAGSQDKRAALTDAMEALREMTERCGCYTVALSQTSRGNAPMLSGRVEISSSTDAAGAGAESSEVENASSYLITMAVFKANDAPELDAIWHVGKARWTGGEGPVGARYTKAGGVWTELDHLPATPLEVDAEVKRAKRGGTPAAPSEARVALNVSRSTASADKRREAIIGALRAAGAAGLVARELRRVRGAGSAARQRETLDELAKIGRARSTSGRWTLIA